MADEPFYSPNRRARQAPAPKPTELLWETWHDHARWTCELVFHGESYGWETRICKNSELFVSRRFLAKAMAVGWGDFERRDLSRGLVVDLD